MGTTKRTPSQNGKMSRRKGIEFELDLVKKVKHIWPDAKRALECQQGLGYDLENTGTFRFQCKNYANYAPISKINEIPDDPDTVPVLVTKGSRMKPMAVLPLEDLIDMISYIRLSGGKNV